MNIGFSRSIIILLLVFWFTPIFSQVLSKKEFIKAVQEADISFYYDEDYESAASQYENLLKTFPGNANLAAKLGICYLNLDGKKATALKLLQKASSNVTINDQDYLEFGDTAPLDTWLYLAIAYHQNDSLQKAIMLYSDAKKKLRSTNIFNVDYIDNQINDCRYAIETKKNPIIINPELFLPWLKDYPGACNPVLSKNDSVFIFTLKKAGKTRILCSYKSGTWKLPVDITKQLGGSDTFYSNSITGDGKLLIISMNDGGNGSLYYSQRKDTIWTKVKSMGKPVNTVYWEAFGSITPDGNTLYIASNRPGGYGELDIWISEKAPDGKWKQPVNCGKEINTPYNENTPFFIPESNTLLFSSVGHTGMGGYDAFRSVRRNGVWTSPLALPCNFNSTIDNTFFIPLANEKGYMTSLYDEKTGTRNIYSLLSDDNSAKIIQTQGTLSLQDDMPVDPGLTNIQLFEQKTGVLLKNISVSDSGSFSMIMKPGKFKVIINRIGDKSDTIAVNVRKENIVENKSFIDTASFRFEIKPGDYQLFVNHVGYKTDTINLNIPSRFAGNYISIHSSLVPEKVFNGDFLTIKNLLFEYDSYKLTDKSALTLETLKSVLLNYPDLNIEVAGYTDSRGSNEYNRSLSDKRAQAVINYFSGAGISKQRFVKKAYGNSRFVARNTNPDGSDNPEGRKYNRRVTFGIINPKTGVVLHQESYIPEHLRQHPEPIIKPGKEDKIYTIQLSASRQRLNMKQFEQVNGVRELSSEDGYYRYVYGKFGTVQEAKGSLDRIHNSGFKAAFIRQFKELF